MKNLKSVLYFNKKLYKIKSIKSPECFTRKMLFFFAENVKKFNDFHEIEFKKYLLGDYCKISQQILLLFLQYFLEGNGVFVESLNNHCVVFYL